MVKNVHTFDNGLKVSTVHLTSGQRKRYSKCNVHEAEEEAIFTDIIRSIPSDGLFVDIGSAIGYYPILAKKLSPGLTIHAVEPLELHRKYFIENIELNNMNVSDFQIHAEGISSSDGFVTFVEKRFSSRIEQGQKERKSFKSEVKASIKKLLFHLGFNNFEPPRKNVIPTITLDRLIDIVGRPVDVLQMDVQGLELDVLKGGLRSMQTGYIKTFLIGTHSHSLHRECLDFLQKFDYRIEFENSETKKQPDGIIVGSKGVSRLPLPDAGD